MQEDFLNPEWLFAPILALGNSASYPANVIRQYQGRARLAGLTRWLVRSTTGALADYRYIFYGKKYTDIILGLPKSQVLVIGGPAEWAFCRKHDLAFYSFTEAYQAVAQAIATQEVGLLKRCYQDYRRDFSGSVAKFLIVSNDGLPATRFLIGALRAIVSMLQVVCIQHGVYQGGYTNKFIDGHMSDINLVYDQYQAEILLRNGVAASTIRVFGFHSDYVTARVLPEQPRVCLLGEGWHKYNLERGARYFALMKQLKRDFAARGIPVIYRPHPGEGSWFARRHFCKIDRCSLAVCFERFDLFIGVSSTVLLEANMAGKCAVQIRDPLFAVDDYSELGYCQTFDMVDVNAIVVYYQCWRQEARVKPVEPAASRFKNLLAEH